MSLLLTRRAPSARCVVPPGSGEAARQPGPLVSSRGPPTSQWGHKSARNRLLAAVLHASHPIR